MISISDIDWHNFDWCKVTINREDLIDWLIRRGVTPEFFADEIQARKTARMDAGAVSTVPTILNPPVQHQRIPAYLNPEHPRYAPKLAAAIRAWEAVEDPKGKHPAQAIREWLTRNAKELGLLKDGGELNKSAIDDIAKIANWQPKGGAPKTPG